MKKNSKNKMPKMVKGVVKVEKKVFKAVEKDASKLAGKVKKHLNAGVLLAEAVAGITLIATLGAYSVYLVSHGGKKIDFKKMKINVLREVRKATEEAKRIGEMEVKKIEEEARKVTRKR